jgi:hypothetical protein
VVLCHIGPHSGESLKVSPEGGGDLFCGAGADIRLGVQGEHVLPARAARYAEVLKSFCDHGDRCRVIAGEFIDDGRWKEYLDKYQEALDITPAAWGFHPYHDVDFSERFRTGAHPLPLSKTHAAYMSAQIPGDEPLWFTEVGSRIDTSFNGNDVNQANADTDWLLDTLIPGISNGVNRLYYYQLCEPNADAPGVVRHDSGLVDRSANCSGAVRPMYTTYQTKTLLHPNG